MKKPPNKPPNKPPGSGKRPPKRTKKAASGDLTILRFVPNSDGGGNAKDDSVRDRFYLAYEETSGNVTASCIYAGISRPTYYNWMDSRLPEHIEFQRRLKEIKPVELLLDIAEGVVAEHLRAKSLSAAQYVLDRKGKGRGYADRSNLTEHQLTVRAVERILRSIERKKSAKPNFVPDINRFIELASEDFGISKDAVEQELTRRLSEEQK